MPLPDPPERKPADPRFATGPARKRPGWSPAALGEAVVGRSHRSPEGRARLTDVIARSRELLGIPESHAVAVLPGSDTGAFEAALWNLLGARGVDVLAWDGFGRTWLRDIVDQLGLTDVRALEAPDGELADPAAVDGNRDLVFPWVGTTTGVMVPDGAWIAPDRTGLTICDATSAVFAVDLPWDRLDVATWSWQKVLGGEAQHGMIALSPRAIARLESHVPPWPIPKVFRLAERGRVKTGLFSGGTLNTPSMLCVEDALDALAWAAALGGLPALKARCRRNLDTVADWVGRRAWVDFLAADPATRAPTSLCLRPADPWIRAQPEGEQRRLVQRMAELVAEHGAGHDLMGHRDAPATLRIWGGATVDPDDVAALLPWLDWAYACVLTEHGVEPRAHGGACDSAGPR